MRHPDMPEFPGHVPNKVSDLSDAHWDAIDLTPYYAERHAVTLAWWTGKKSLEQAAQELVDLDEIYFFAYSDPPPPQWYKNQYERNLQRVAALQTL